MKKYSGIPQRIGATIIDLLITTLVSIVIAFVSLELSKGLFSKSNYQMEFDLALLIRRLSALVFIYINNIYFVGKSGNSFGQKCMKIKVVDVKTGKHIGINRAFLRKLVEPISGLILGLGYLWILWDRKKQGWHDKIAEDIVIKI